MPPKKGMRKTNMSRATTITQASFPSWKTHLLKVLLIMVAMCFPFSSAFAAIEDVLYDSGTITKEDWQKIKDEKKMEAATHKQSHGGAEGALTWNTKKRSWVDSVVWSGDFRFREENFSRFGPGATANDRNRLRFRLRFGPTITINDFTIVGRLASGGSDPASTNQSFTTAFSSKPVQIDWAYASWHPSSFPAMTITGGKMKNPFKKNYTTDVLFDGDISPEGIAEQFRHKITPSVTVFADFAQFVLNEISTDTNDQWMLVFQGGGEVTIRNVKARMAVGYYDSTNLQQAGIGEANGQGFNSKIAAPSGGAFVNDYNVLNVNGSIDTILMGFPINVQGDYVINTAYDITCGGGVVTANTKGACGAGNFAVKNQDQGYQVGIRVGKARKAKTWEIAYYYKWLQADAVLSSLADSDLGTGGTNRRGNIVWVAYNPTDFLKFQAKFFNTKPLERGICAGSPFSSTSCNDDIDRLQVDMVWKF